MLRQTQELQEKRKRKLEKKLLKIKDLELNRQISENEKAKLLISLYQKQQGEPKFEIPIKSGYIFEHDCDM